MSSLIETMNNMAVQWSDGMWLIVWQSTALAAIVYLLTLCLRRASAAACFWLWMLVPLRLLVMPLITVSLPLLPAVTPEQERTHLASVPVEAIVVSPGGGVLSGQQVGVEQSEPIASAPLEKRLVDKQVLPSLWGLLMTGWLAGLGLCVTRLFSEWRRVMRIAAEATESADGRILKSAQAAGAALGVRHLPRVLVTRECISPFLFGVWKPVLVVPERLVSNVHTEEVIAVLAHEFAHLRRRDPLIGWLLAICEAVYFFHPVFYSVKRRILFERERACDSWVVTSSETRSGVYANALISAADLCRGFRANVGPVGVVAESFGDLKKRLTAINKNLKPKARLSIASLVALVVLIAICTPGILLTARAQEETSPETSDRQEETPQSLHAAIKAGDLAEVKSLIAQGVDVNASEGDRTWTPLAEAANRGHSEIVKVLLANGADVDKADGYYTPLYYAIWNNDNVTVRALIDAGADVNIVPHEKDYSPVAYAIWQGHVDNVKTLLEAGADLNVKDQEGLTPFYWAAFSGYKNILDLILSKRDWPDTIHLAAYRGNLDKVTTLIEEGTEVNVEDAFACTPLHWAALADSPAVADYLIAKGADLEARDKGSWTPLMSARTLPVVELLVAKGADINARNERRGWTKLQMACVGGDKDVTEFLLSKTDDVNAKDENGGSLLALAASRGHTDIVELLIAKGAKINVTDNQGRTPLDVATRRGHTEVVSILRQHGAKETLHGAVASGNIEEVKRLITEGVDVNVKNETNETPLHIAASRGSKDVAELLIAKGAIVNVRGNSNTPLHLAARNGRTTLVELLLNKGADINANDNQGYTPLGRAMANKHPKVIALLREHGAKESLHDVVIAGDIDAVKRFLAEGCDVNARDSLGLTPLHLAAMHGHTDIIELLIANGADLEARDRHWGNTPLLHATPYGRTEAVKLLLEKGANIEARGGHGLTPLCLASTYGTAIHTDVIQVLLDKGANIESHSYGGATPLMGAMSVGRKGVAEMLLARGAQLNVISRFYGTAVHLAMLDNRPDIVRWCMEKGIAIPPLHMAAYLGDMDAVRSLVRGGADVNQKDVAQFTPLHCTVFGNNSEIMQFLIDKGADIEARNCAYRTPLFCACERGYPEMVRPLLAKGADLNTRGFRKGMWGHDFADDWTPLHIAAQMGHTTVVQYLMNKDASIHAKCHWLDDEGVTPLHLAAWMGRDDTAKALLAKGADPNRKTTKGQTPLGSARERNQTTTIQLLREHGAKG